jgi:hypothetical protein
MARRNQPQESTLSGPVLREIQAKKKQVHDQILRGVPEDYAAYTNALGMYRALDDLETFTLNVMKKAGDIVDLD